MTISDASRGCPRKVVGVIPAAGHASRIAPLPCSKELYPIGFRLADSPHGVRPKVVCHYLLDKMRLAGVTQVFIVLRNGKWDIPSYLGDGQFVSLNLAYLMMGAPFGPPYTVDQAYSFVRDDTVVFGFPDILFWPEDAFVQLLNRHAASNADIVLGLFPAHDPAQMDMVDIDSTGRVRGLCIQPHTTDLRYAWVCAVWAPTFTHFMHDTLVRQLGTAPAVQPERSESSEGELSVGAVIQVAIQKGLRVDGVEFPMGTYLDIGTPDGLAKATHIGDLQ